MAWNFSTDFDTHKLTQGGENFVEWEWGDDSLVSWVDFLRERWKRQ